MKNYTASNLDRFIDAVQNVAQLAEQPDVRSILDIGFGQIDELVALSRAFPYSKITAIDSDTRVVASAKLAKETRTLPDVMITMRDARGLTIEDLSSIGLIVIRHPDVDKLLDSWGQAIPHILHLMRRPSVLCCLTYCLKEMEGIRTFIDRARVKAVPGAPYSTLPVALNGADRHICAFLKN